MSHTVNPATDNGGSTSEFGFEGETAVVEREGLPRGYRMRADKHYVDVMAAHSTDQPVRMVPTAQIDCDTTVAATDLSVLIDSVQAVGIVHPLLLRRDNGRYAVVAGRKRFTVARILQLPTVPCLIHELDDAKAQALAAADNVMVAFEPATSIPSALPLAIRDLISQHLVTTRACGDLAASGSPSLTRPVFDLIRAHSWRAAKLGDALDLATNVPQRPGRERALAVALDEVVKGFEPESRLNGFTLRAYTRGELSTNGLNDHDIIAGVSGAVLALLPLIEQSTRPSLLITASSAGPGSVVIEITQSEAPVSAELARHFLDDESAGRRGGYAAVVGALAACALATRYAGTISFDAGVRGSTLKLVLARHS